MVSCCAFWLYICCMALHVNCKILLAIMCLLCVYTQHVFMLWLVCTVCIILIWFTLINYDHTKGRRSKIESGKAKFYGQFLASSVNIIGDFYNFWKQFGAKGSSCLGFWVHAPRKVFWILCHLRWHSGPFWTNLQFIINIHLNIIMYNYIIAL